MRTRLLASSGTPDQVSGGEMSAPSQVYCAGISPPGGIAGLVMTKGMTISSALPSRRHATGRPCRRGAAMSFDPEPIRAFEHAGWQRAAAHYTATFAQATTGFVGGLLD